MWRLMRIGPIWVQLTEQLTEQIIAGRYEPGERMPSVRDLAAEAGVNPNTMQRAMAELEAMGLARQTGLREGWLRRIWSESNR